jgi:predicted lactoylglutathione lyase
MKPKKFIGANPHLPVKNLQQTLAYYRDNLGFYEEWTLTNDEGKVIDGGIRRDDIHAYGLKEFAFADINGYYIRVTEGADEE